MNEEAGERRRRGGLDSSGVLIVSLVAAIAAVAPVHGDALRLLGAARQSTISVGDAIDTNTNKKTWYDGIALDVQAGVNLTSNSSITDSSLGNLPVSVDPLLSQAPVRISADLSWNMGQSVSLAAGIDLAPKWRISGRVGLAYNLIDELQIDIKATENLTGTVVTLESYTVSDGHLMQVPIDVVLRYELAKFDALSVGLSAGMGMQISWLEISGGSFTSAYLPGSLDLDVSGREIAFRYLGGIDLMWEISSSVSLGFDASFAGSSRSAFSDDIAFSIYNVVIGARLTIAF